MKTFEGWNIGYLARLGGLAAALLFVLATGVKADDTRKKQTDNPPPARQHQQGAPQQRVQQAPPRAIRQAPQPARQPAMTPAPAAQQQAPRGTPGYNRPSQPSGQAPFGRTPPPNMQQTNPRLDRQGQAPISAPPARTAPSTQPRQFGRQPDAAPSQGRAFGRTAEPRNVPGYTARPNVRVERGPANRQVVHAPNGAQIHMDSHGRVAEVRTSNGAVIRHTPDGFRRVEVTRPGGRVVVVNGHNNGYVQRTVMVRNRSYVQRTYVVRGAMVTRVYRPYVVRPGVVVNVYAPTRYYRPSYYAYAYRPWARPVVYTSWGWGGAPWYGYYGGYFAPAPYYPSPAFWLTDYMIAATLEQAYLDRAASNQTMAPAFSEGQPGLTPDVKQAIADEVSRQLRQEQQEAQSAGANADTNPFSGDTPHIFIANASVEAMMGDQSCAVSEGDVLELRGAAPLDASAANVLVRASKGGCPEGASVAVNLQDLAEMQNHMREVIDRGLGDMQGKQGQNGLPAIASDAAAPATPVAWASQISADQGAASELSQVSDETARSEQEAVNGALLTDSSEAAPSAARPTIGTDSSIDEVLAAFGQPQRTVDLGAKKIFIYRDVKITFQDGKVVDVQ
jgi:hypothetical protein